MVTLPSKIIEYQGFKRSQGITDPTCLEGVLWSGLQIHYGCDSFTHRAPLA